MKALLIVESWFGNTRLIAGAVADGAAEAGAQVEMVDVDAAPRVVPEDVDLLMLGAPTHNLGLSTVATRRKALAAGASPGNTGIREWLNQPNGSWANGRVTVSRARPSQPQRRHH